MTAAPAGAPSIGRAAVAALAAAGALVVGGCAPAPVARDAAPPADVAVAPAATARPRTAAAPLDATAGAVLPLHLAAGADVERRLAEVVAVYPHDPAAFTQGLLLADDDTLIESTGLYGQSSLREVELASGRVLRRLELPPDLFAEGVALVGERLWQLTWREQLALQYDAAEWRMVDSVRYEGEGWGLCHDGRRLVMSDGSSRLTFRDPETFAVVGGVNVRLGGAGVEVAGLNELECVSGAVYANVWQTDEIVRIDAATGAVEALVDASGLLTARERAAADVLNGIAYRAAGNTFLVTGKLWPWLFEVRFVVRDGG